jgi:hypothetical protein
MATAILDAMPTSYAVEQYLDELRPLRKNRTLHSAQQVLEEYLALADPNVVRSIALRAGSPGASRRGIRLTH